MYGNSSYCESPYCSAPHELGETYLQTVSASIATSSTLSVNVGKAVDYVQTAAAAISNRAIAFSVTVIMEPAISVRKAVVTKLDNVLTSPTAVVIKNVGKALVSDVVTVTATMLPKTIGKIVHPVQHLRARLSATTLFITSRAILQDAVDYVLAGTQPLESSGREWETHNPNVRTSTRVMRSGVRNLGGEKPSFTVRTSPPKPPKRK